MKYSDKIIYNLDIIRNCGEFMKKLNSILILLLSIVVFIPKIYAAPTAASNIDYSSCLAFADTFTAITNQMGSYYYKSCYRATCSNKVYTQANMVQNIGYRCLNGNSNPYVKVTSDACASYKGSCNNNNSIYCETVKLVDCNKTASGGVYVNPNTTVIATTTSRVVTTTVRTQAPVTKPPTTRKTTVKNTNTVPKTFTNPTTSSVTTTIPTTETTTTTVKVDSAEIKSIYVDDKKVEKYKPSKDTYKVGVPVGQNDVNIKVNLVDPVDTTTVEITGNTDIPEEGGEVKILITTKEGTTNQVILKLERIIKKSSDCNLMNIHMDDYDLGFTSKVYDYKLKLPKNVTSLDIQVVPSDDEHATYVIKDNEKLKNNSKVSIEVRAEDGTTCVYTIKVRKSSNTWKYILLIVLLLGALSVTSYFLYKYLKKSKGQYKYE